jgi:signal peptidase II
MRQRVTRLFVALLMLGLVACDQGTKLAAAHALSGGRVVTVVPGVFDLRYALNRGAAFSTMEHWGHALVLAVTLLSIAAVVIGWIRMRRAAWPTHVAFALVVSGAIANMSDRVVRGAVVDFAHLRGWPVFNVADVAITIGAVALALVSMRKARAPA